jgi:putative phosphoribosyl transferase
MKFKNRKQAGELLATKINIDSQNLMLIGLTRGGVEVAYYIAKKLSAPLSVLVVKKIRSPLDSELSLGAITEDSVSYVDWKQAGRNGADTMYIQLETEKLKDEIKKVRQKYMPKNSENKIDAKTVVIVDDGIATGATIKAAIMWVRAKGAKKIIIAAPVAPNQLLNQIKSSVDELVILETPGQLQAVSDFYDSFPEVSDEKILKFLNGEDEAGK